ncbi:hypothetical protein BDW59DRAFT_181332 [Aspergillus cavernicola]|uniref:FR47-like domain-containing protein n=1 Tax=Aspergillus cavernicola TaxID=176166 RepID=A0ABR4HZD6_9EURO
MYIHHHPYTSLLSHLTTHLPNSGPLLRRVQYQSTHNSPTAHILATLPPESESGPPDPGSPWLAAYADIHRGPDTQIWLFSSLEANTTLTGKEREITKSQLLTLFTKIRVDLIPPYLETFSASGRPVAVPGEEEQEKEQEQGIKKIPAHPKTSFLLGTVHARLVDLICELSSETLSTSTSSPKLNPTVRILRGQNVFYAKYCFPSSSFSIPVHELEKAAEAGYKFHDPSTGISGIQSHHLDLVKSRTHIPRSKEALLAMGGVALYYYPSTTSSTSLSTSRKMERVNMPIAWAFLGFDGSLTSLHVEVEHRGKGLGGLVGREVMQRGVDVFGPKPESESASASGDGSTREREEWFYADVAVDNGASRRVMEKMGGVGLWDVAWMVIEVDV